MVMRCLTGPQVAHRTCEGCLQDAWAQGAGGASFRWRWHPADGKAQLGSLDRP